MGNLTTISNATVTPPEAPMSASSSALGIRTT
jgi:hypothetical protein